jgi:predicted small secreted protein
MFRQIPTRISLVLCCALSLSACSPTTSGDGTELSPTAAGYALAAAGDMALAAAQAAGMQLTALPSTGCSPSLLAPERVVELLMTLPDAQRTALATVLDASAGVWTAQLYKGEQGAGLCLPVQGVLALLPASANATVDKLAAAAAPVTNNLVVTP